jgi:diguanylate cyclase (GGDEF)-like protein
MRLLLPVCRLLAVCLLLPALAAAAGSEHSARQYPEPLLTTVAQVHALTPEQAARHIPVKLRGVVTAFSGWRDYYFFQDATGGIAINREEHGPVHAGDEVELTGVSDPGLFATSVISLQVRVVGPGTMPATRLYGYSDLEGGTKDAEWVAVRGVVQSAQVEQIWEKSVLVLDLESGGQQISIRVFHFDPADVSRFVDALVEVKGVCGSAYNDKRQFTGLRLFASDTKAVTVLEPAPPQPYAVETSPIRSVMQFGHGRRARHRLKISGVVTYQDKGRSLYIQEGADGILLFTPEAEAAPVGTRIEALGFPAMGTYSPVLKNATFRVMGGGNRVVPATIRAADFLQYKDTFAYAPYDGQLVHVRGEVVSPLALPNEDAWLMRDGQGDFVATLRRDPDRRSPRRIVIGSTMSVTGVMEVTVDSDRRPQSFRVLLRDPADLIVLEGAPWWTPLHLSMVLGLLLVATMAVVLWTMLLRRQVLQKTQQLRESEGRFRNMAQRDALTGIASRSFLHEQLEAAVRDADETGRMIGLLMLDLDHFKQVNDTMGHHAGDQLLCIVARRIQSTVRKSDVVARMGGDEFVVLLTDIGDEGVAEAIGAKLVANVAVPAEIGDSMMAVSASVGISTYPAGGADPDDLLKNADEAMYRAKSKGRNNSCVYEKV